MENRGQETGRAVPVAVGPGGNQHKCASELEGADSRNNPEAPTQMGIHRPSLFPQAALIPEVLPCLGGNGSCDGLFREPRFTPRLSACGPGGFEHDPTHIRKLS